MYKCIYSNVSAIAQRLSQQLRRFERAHRSAACVSTGIAAFDRLLPEGGLRTGSLVEWLADGASGAGTLAFGIAARLRSESQVAVVIDGNGSLYPPAIRRFGCDPDATIVVRPQRAQNALWAWEQSLRCPAVAVVVGWLNRLQSVQYRRLQLAAETGGGIGMLLRPAREHRQPSWAGLRLLVKPQPLFQPPSQRLARERPPPRSRRLQVELLHSRGLFESGTALLDIDDETGVVRLAPRLVPATNPRRAAGA